MNGPEHYREAERLLDVFKEAHIAAESMPDATVEQFEKRAMAISTARVLLDKAQVHATLAHADAAERNALAVENLPTYEGMLSVYAFGVNGR